jgi:hypothetical protein
MSTQPFTITVNFRTDVIPPRCRKPRCVDITETLHLSIRTITKADAPVIATIKYTDRGISGYTWEQEFRQWGGTLFTRQVRNHARDKPDHYAEWQSEQVRNLAFIEDFEKVKPSLSARNKHLLIDGEWWSPSGIPILALTVHGGFNYSCVRLDVDFVGQGQALTRLQYPILNAGGTRELAEKMAKDLHYDESFAELNITIYNPELLDIQPLELADPTKRPSLRSEVLVAIEASNDSLDREDLKRLVDKISETRSVWFDQNTLYGSEFYYKPTE